MHGEAAQNDSAANRNTNKTALRIIIDLPSYLCVHTCSNYKYFRSNCSRNTFNTPNTMIMLIKENIFAQQ
jgi:hypothetical protein